MHICQICQSQHNSISLLSRHVTTHITRGEYTSLKDYYDKFLGSKKKCEECDKDAKYHNFTTGYLKTCGDKACERKATMRTKENKTDEEKELISNKISEALTSRGDEAKELTNRKRAETCLEIYGTANVAENEDVKKKIKAKVVETYEVDNVSKSEEVKAKKVETCLRNHGEPHHSKSQAVKDKTKNTNLDRYGFENVSQVPEFKEKRLQTWEKKKDQKEETEQPPHDNQLTPDGMWQLQSRRSSP